MKLLLASVPHTGTQFLAHLLMSHPEIKTRIGLDAAKTVEDTLDYDFAQAHFGIVDDLIWQLARLYPVATPVRDPLLAMISHKARHGVRDNTWTIQGWHSLLNFAKQHNQAFYPVDLLADFQQRIAHLHHLLHCLDLKLCDEVVHYVEDWAVKNTVGINQYRQAYIDGDKGFLQHALRDEWQALVENELILRPFLESLGYTKLLWWSY